VCSEGANLFLTCVSYTGVNSDACGRCGPGSVVGIATGYGLGGPGIESRWGARFSAPVQSGPGTHTASCTMGTGSFQGVKRPGRGVIHPHLEPRLNKE